MSRSTVTTTVADTVDTADESIEDRVRRCLPLVQYAVHELGGRVPAHVDRDDLVSAGMLGLAQAARSWEPDRGVAFDRYARRRIQGAILDELRGLDWATRSVRAGARMLQSAGERLRGATGEAPSSEQLGRELGLPVDAVRRLVAEVDRARVLHFDALVGEEAAPSSTQGGDQPVAALLQREVLGYLRDAVRSLPENLRRVVLEYYFDERQMQDIAGELGVTESRVSQMRAEAVKLLRTALQACLGGDPTPDAPPATGRAAARTAAYVAEVASAADLHSRLTPDVAPTRGRLAATA